MSGGKIRKKRERRSEENTEKRQHAATKDQKKEEKKGFELVTSLAIGVAQHNLILFLDRSHDKNLYAP